MVAATTSVDTLLRGVSPVLAVPFDDDGGLDLDGFAAVVDHVLASGVTSLMLFGLASEFHKLTDDERGRLLDVLLARTTDRHDVAVICSVTDHATHPAARRARQYAERGVDAVNLLPPHFLAPSPDAVVDHLDAVMASVDVPVVVQYAPAQTGTTLRPAELSWLAERHGNFRLVKVECTPPGPMIAALGEVGLDCFVGQAGIHLPDAVASGAVGVQPGCSMIPLYREMWDAAMASDDAELEATHGALLPTLCHWMTSVELIVQAEKAVLHRLGVISSAHCRAPSAPLDPFASALVDAVVARLREMRG